jgi:hypothetical protein
VVAFVSHAPARTEQLAGLDPGLGAVVGAGVMLVAFGLVLRWLTGAGGRSRRDALEARKEAAVASQAASAGPEEDTPERPGCRRAATTPSGFSDLPLPESLAGDRGPVLGSASITALAATLDRSRRLVAAEEFVARALAGLPTGCWIVERYALVGGRRIPFVVVGAGGVFVLAASDGAWTMGDLEGLASAGEHVRELLPGYPGPVHAGVCLAFDEMAPRRWHGGTERAGRGGWVLGIDWLQAWLYAQRPEQGIGSEELRRLHAEAGPRWSRRGTARLPGRHNVG